ncbi:MAG: class I SAM-dependent methyltransferase [Planctomycetes bacterium]|nr:class I SAM-dependent methyltransferase [Planctomycetota bacterium]
MPDPEFDHFAESYKSELDKQKALTGDREKFFRYKVSVLSSLFSSAQRILDFGCGTGNSITYLNHFFPQAKIVGYDLSPKSIAVAKKRFENLFYDDLEQLTAQENKFDLIFMSCVLHHIPLDKRVAVLKHISTLLNAKGSLCLFEHNPYNPLTQYLVKTCDLDEGVVLSSMSKTKELLMQAGLVVDRHAYALFFPILNKFTLNLEQKLKAVPLGGQYYLVASSNVAADN